MATNTYMTYLMSSTDSKTYTKLVDIINYPDLGSIPDKLGTTTLSDKMFTNILGIEGAADSLEFDILYDKETFTKLKAMENKTIHLAVWMGANSAGQPDGNLGKFMFDGMLSVLVTGAGVNEVRKAKLTLAASTPITFE